MRGLDKITAAILIIGDEILSGRTVDQNTSYIAKHLGSIGITLCEVRIIADIEAEIVSTVNELRTRHDYLFTTGGIGPTHDDITSDSIARAFDVPIEIDERAVEMMRQRYSDDELQGDRLRMARIPIGSELIENPISHTPGFIHDNVIVLAGIPAIMQVMLDFITPKLRKGNPFLTLSIRVVTPESQIATTLKEVQNHFSDLSLGSYPFFENDVLGTHLVLRSAHKQSLAKAKEMLMTKLIDNNLSPHIIKP
jgi:molybdenum cofactor synthesis domain-containing protein